MASTTTNKKQIVDFLWEWAESHGDWGKLLISKIVINESNLLPTDRQTVFNYFLQSINLHSGLPALTVTKPTYTPTAKQIVLESLSGITGVNRLAKNQTVNFAKSITIIYGENGTGKTGYSRILKTLGFSYDSYNNILSNIFATREAKAATIKFKANGTDQTFTWDGTNKDTELQNISVFNSNCVQISLSDRQLIVSPIGFHLFNLVTSELQELTGLLNAKSALHPTFLLWSESLTIGTPQQIFISTLSGTSTEQKLTELSTFTPEKAVELKAKETELSNLNKALLQNEIQNLTASISEIGTLVNRIQTAQGQLTSANWKTLIELNKQIKILEGQTQIGIKGIAEINGIAFYKTEQFQSFINAAEEYIKIIGKPDYPSKDDTCVYCLQPLEKPAQELLKSYRTLLNDKTQENLSQVKQQKLALINLVSQVDNNLIFHQPSFGADEKQNPVQPTEIKSYNKLLGALKTTFITDKVSADTTFSFDYLIYITLLTEKSAALNIVLTERRNSLSNLASKELELKNKIAELKDRKLLSTKVAEIKGVIQNHKIVSTLSTNSGSFNSYSISRKTSDAREHLVQQNFKDIFTSELKTLRKSNLPIDLSFGTERGNSKVSPRISAHLLTEILSEGEQKAIALAEFMTELQLDNIKAPVIFDDPVNSLDHRIIDEVAKRFIELSKQRQVIVFTHSILILHSFIQQYELEHHKQAGVEFIFHRVKDNFEMTGILDEVEEINSYSYYTKKLNNILATNPAGQDESKLAAEGYGHLRSAIEITVEDNLLQKTIKRYKKGIAFPSLLRIDGSKVDSHKGKLNDIYEKCCVSIDGHSSPSELPSSPKIAELKIDYDEFKTLRANFTQNRTINLRSESRTNAKQD